MREGLRRPPAAYCSGTRGCSVQPLPPPPGIRSLLVPRSHLGPSESPSAGPRGTETPVPAAPPFADLPLSALQVGVFAPQGVSSRGGEDREPLVQPARRDAARAAALSTHTLRPGSTRSGRPAERRRLRGCARDVQDSCCELPPRGGPQAGLIAGPCGPLPPGARGCGTSGPRL